MFVLQITTVSVSVFNLSVWALCKCVYACVYLSRCECECGCVGVSGWVGGYTYNVLNSMLTLIAFFTLRLLTCTHARISYFLYIDACS